MEVVITFQRGSMAVGRHRLKDRMYRAVHGCFADGSLDFSGRVPILVKLEEKPQVPCKRYGFKIDDRKEDCCCSPGEDWAKHGRDRHAGLANASRRKRIGRNYVLIRNSKSTHESTLSKQQRNMNEKPK